MSSVIKFIVLPKYRRKFKLHATVDNSSFLMTFLLLCLPLHNFEYAIGFNVTFPAFAIERPWSFVMAFVVIEMLNLQF